MIISYSNKKMKEMSEINLEEKLLILIHVPYLFGRHNHE